ncbi:DUF1120 domain-containing protein [Pseudomonas nabeulensis]|uniref:DUF1120 domain-containing protein n=1 Tax=Pseudomonas nabeulensis TaxID=2293833 RepID=A0A4Z0ATM1_9PSED|nr:DUF1120 domain-containing protein [Pseudomonas nabeulensis]TFY90172.1 DUF1120 domain-containing protein [Pseudomonas nabeulensis]
MTKLLTLLALLASVPCAQAASSVDLSVSGKITPSACEPSLSNGGVYDLGKIAAKELNADQPTALPVHNLQLTLTCAGSTLVALKPSDNRSGSHFDNETVHKFGLGLVNGNEKLGSMALNLQSIMADGAEMRAISSVGTTSWGPSSILSAAFLSSFTFNWSTPNLAPDPIQHLSAQVQITPRIAPANTLTLTKEVPIDGSVTLEINYL